VSVLLKQGRADQKQWAYERQFCIGRDSTADICISDPTVSRFHTFVHLVKGTWWIRDMNSSNGTFINGKQVSKHPVNSQTILQLGQSGPILHLCSDAPNPLNSETVIVDLSDFNPKKKTEPKIATSAGTPERMKLSGVEKTHLNKWRKMFPAAILATMVLAGYLFLQNDGGSVKEQQQIQTIENQPDPIRNRHTDPSKADAQKKRESASANRMSQPNRSHPAQDRVGQDQNKSMGLQQEIIRNHIAEIYFNAAKKFSRHRRWQAASSIFQIVSKLNPDYPRLNEEKAILEFEIKNQKTYQQALAHLKAERYKHTIIVLSQIPPESVYYPEAGQLIVNVEEKRVQAAKVQKK
jgi:pSer/pThr/pTyr-binding forkhead associated (FHA) protein